MVEGIDTMRLFPISTSSDSSPREQKISDKSHAPLYLNVYDLTPINNYLYWVGCGVFHSGIEGIINQASFFSNMLNDRAPHHVFVFALVYILCNAGTNWLICYQ